MRWRDRTEPVADDAPDELSLDNVKALLSRERASLKALHDQRDAVEQELADLLLERALGGVAPDATRVIELSADRDEIASKIALQAGLVQRFEQRLHEFREADADRRYEQNHAIELAASQRGHELLEDYHEAALELGRIAEQMREARAEFGRVHHHANAYRQERRITEAVPKPPRPYGIPERVVQGTSSTTLQQIVDERRRYYGRWRKQED